MPKFCDGQILVDRCEAGLEMIQQGLDRMSKTNHMAGQGLRVAGALMVSNSMSLVGEQFLNEEKDELNPFDGIDRLYTLGDTYAGAVAWYEGSLGDAQERMRLPATCEPEPSMNRVSLMSRLLRGVTNLFETLPWSEDYIWLRTQQYPISLNEALAASADGFEHPVGGSV